MIVKGEQRVDEAEDRNEALTDLVDLVVKAAQICGSTKTGHHIRFSDSYGETEGASQIRPVPILSRLHTQ
ncbi:hypothetical protein ABW16_21125 [Mycolicibacter heraklionensis]|uniref:Uncharacterized protein n=1 Tax=Mycolicibacter heraklionensis TaxID=512402 RepID=A0ABR5FA53_9MYCO|nr:hypothetical protein ABW16_21125 [Mycolicibacter heraklionensis]